MGIFGVFAGFFPEETTRPIPDYQRKYLRRDLAKELSSLRKEMGFATMHSLARAAKVSINTISGLEHAQESKKHVTVLSLHKIARALSRTLIIELKDVEKYCSTKTPVEEILSVGARIIFSSEE
jgi:transcriptional regulator with XRE-family HTH domain